MLKKKLVVLILSAFIGLCLGSCEASEDSSDGSLQSQSSDTASQNEPSTQSESDISFEGEISSEDPRSENTSFVEEIEVNMETYTNPIMDQYTNNAWKDYGFGDPFVMRYNGKYYLYSSTKDGEVGIKVWISDDLVNWKYRGLCADSELTTGAYAPEVTYYNGAFYMYTSPAGNGHYVLCATNPLGPFKPVTENLGNSIDGHVFIDDNGKWYFYRAETGAIIGKEMSSPTDLSGAEYDLGISVDGGWTEGPMIIKDNGVYYLTYCGNHVWSKGYRIHGATSTTSPLEFKDVEDYIIMVNTSDPVWGIGHSSTVLGPDLDTYYIVYHSFKSIPKRAMNISPIALNGTDFSISGPTTTPQQQPIGADIVTDSLFLSDDFDYNKATIINGSLAIETGGTVFTKKVIEGNKFTAEFNFKTISELSGILFDYTDENNYGKAFIDVEEQRLSIEVYTNDKRTFRMKFALPVSFEEPVNFQKLQALKIKKDGSKYSFFLNGLLICSINAELPNGKLGIKAEKGTASMGYIAISYNTNGSSLKNYYKPIEGEIQAINSVEYFETAVFNGVNYIIMNQGNISNYRVNISEKSTYDIAFEYISTENSTIEVYKGERLIGTVNLPSTNGENKFVPLRNISLEEGFGIISFKLTSGSANMRSFTFTKSEVLTSKTEIDLSEPYYKDGNWSNSAERLYLPPNPDGYISHGKLLYGNEGWSDYSVSANFKSNTLNMSYGLLFRASNPAMGGSGFNSFEGKYFAEGYYVFITSGALIVYDLNFGYEEILNLPMEFTPNETYNLKVEVIDNSFRIYVNDEYVGEFTDEKTPHLNGAVGITGMSTEATVTNLVIEPIDKFTE